MSKYLWMNFVLVQLYSCKVHVSLNSSFFPSCLQSSEPPKSGLVATLLCGVAGVSALAGFGATLHFARSGERSVTSDAARHHAAGTRLALRALGWGTAAAIGGTVTLAVATWALAGAPTKAKDFHDVMRRRLGGADRPRASEGRNEFASVKELVDYLLDQDRKAKKEPPK